MYDYGNGNLAGLLSLSRVISDYIKFFSRSQTAFGSHLKLNLCFNEDDPRFYG